MGKQIFLCMSCANTSSTFAAVVDHCIVYHPDAELQFTCVNLSNKRQKTIKNFGIIPKQIQEENKIIIPNEKTTTIEISKKPMHIEPTDNDLEIDLNEPYLNKCDNTDKDTCIESTLQSPSSCALDEDLEYTSDEVDKENYLDKMTKEIINMIPDVMKSLQKNNQEDIYMKFNKLLKDEKFPLTNIAYLLFLDVVEWFSLEDSHQMRYSDEVKQFWRVGEKLFRGRFLRFMGGWKNQGQDEGRFDPQKSSVNFVVPDRKSLENSNPCKSGYTPGVMTEMVHLIASDDSASTNSYKLCVDGKKINMGVRDQGMGDVDLWGYEGPPTLENQKNSLEEDIKIVEKMSSIFDVLESRSIEFVKDTPAYYIGDIKATMTSIIHRLSIRIMDLRKARVKKQLTLEKLSKICSSVEMKKKYAYAISGIKTFLYQIDTIIDRLLANVDKLSSTLSELNETQNLFCQGRTCDLSVQANYECLTGQELSVSNETLKHTNLNQLKQRSLPWHQARSFAKVTGSTFHTALGLNGLKKKQEHFNYVFKNQERPAFSDLEEKRMKYGSENEINAVATLVSKILPVFNPDIKYVEEGCSMSFINNEPFLLVSPDGSGRQMETNKVEFGLEFKCPYPGKLYTTPIYYRLPKYYVIQVLSEMHALKAEHLIFVCYSQESSTVFIINFDERLWETLQKMGIQQYIEEKGSYPRKLPENLKDIQEQLDTFCAEKVKFIAEVRSVQAKQCTHAQTSSVQTKIGLNCHVCSTDVERTTTITMVQSFLYDIKNNMREAFSLCRHMASEILVFIISDLDRIHSRERLYSCPVAYAMKGYSMTTNVMRQMIKDVLKACWLSGLYIPVVSYDGQWYNMVVRASDNNPLTILQLQKDVWKETKKMKKGDILKDIQNTNIVKCQTIFELVEQVEISFSIDNGVRRFDVSGMKEHKPIYRPSLVVQRQIQSNVADIVEPVNISSEKRDEILDSLPPNVVESLDDNIINELAEVIPEEKRTTNYDVANGIEALFESDDGILTEHISISTADHIEEQPSTESNIDGAAMEMSSEPIAKMFDMIKDSKRRNKWSTYKLNDFKDRFKSVDTIKSTFTKEELRTCIDVMKKMIPNVPINYCISWNKDKLVALLYSALWNPALLEEKKKCKSRRTISSLKTLCFRQISKLPKSVLNCIHAENHFPEKLLEWKNDSPFTQHTKINGFKENVTWYSKPEYDHETNQYHFHVLDSHHLFTNARAKCCSTGMIEAGITKDAWIKVARDNFNNMSGLSLAIAEDLVDRQSNAFAKTTFSSEVEEIMRKNGDDNEANFCSLIRQWYEAEDSPGIKADERCRRRLNFREWLLQGVSFNEFPPPGSHIKGIPLIMFEGIMTCIERKIQMYPFVRKKTYNVRATGSLEAENLFGEFQDLDPKGTGVLRPDDVPKAISNACELMKARHDPNRTFFMHTSKAKVYPFHELIQKSDMEDGVDFSCPSQINEIFLKDHVFDLPERREMSRAKRKRGTINGPAMTARGAQPVRMHHKCDESKILPHIRMGIDIS